jgi:archaemetzincin
MPLPSPSQAAFDDVPTAFEPDAEMFTPLPPPLPGDWQAEHLEREQTFEEFAHTAPPRPDKSRRVVYLQPVERFIPDQSPPLDVLRAYVHTYFTLPVQVLPMLIQEEETFTTRFNPHTGTQQFLTTDILLALKHYLPVDAFCVVAITMHDLYPDPDWDFVFDQSSVEDRVSVFSIVRHDPAFYGIPRDEGYKNVLLRRSCKVLIHEIGHLCGLAHCGAYNCSQNGSNHLQENDSRPMHLCPSCLRKLHYQLNFDIMKRYRDLYHFYRQVGFEEEMQWVQQRFAKLVKDRMALLE